MKLLMMYYFMGLLLIMLFACVNSQRPDDHESVARGVRAKVSLDKYLQPVHAMSKWVELVPLSRERIQTQAAKAIGAAHDALRAMANAEPRFVRDTRRHIHMS